MNVNARYPGSTNDTYIWNHSNVQTVLRQLHEGGYEDYYLLGRLQKVFPLKVVASHKVTYQIVLLTN